MSDYQMTGYTQSKELKSSVQRAVEDPTTSWDSESELVIASIRQTLGNLEAEDTAREFNVEGRLTAALNTLEDDLYDTVKHAIENTLAAQQTETEPAQKAGTDTPNPDSDSNNSDGIEWANRDHTGDSQ